MNKESAEPITGYSTKNFTEAAEKAAVVADERGLLPPDEDSPWNVDLSVVVGHHSPSHIKWYRATLTPGDGA